ncbi:MAG: glycosyltransferase [Nitrospirota bacterium]
MRLFAVLYCYPPLLTPATMCYLKLLAGLRAMGHTADALAVDVGSYHGPMGNYTDLSLLQLVPEGVGVHTVRSWERHPLMKMLKDIEIGRRLLYPLFEPQKKEWYFPAVRRLKRQDLRGYDAIISCSQPHANHLIGERLKKLTGKPWIAYLSDPWTDNPWGEYRSKRIRAYNLALERSVIEKADAVLFTSEETLALVMKKYPDRLSTKCGVLPHCYVPEWYRLGASRGRDGGGRTRILHTGHFYGLRSPMPVFAALEALSRETDLAERAELLFFGTMEARYREFVRERKLDRVIRIMETVPYLDALSMMLSSDYLLLVDAPLKNTAESVFLPSKLIDYLGSFRPVIGITPSRGTSAKVLKETGGACCAIEDDRAVRRTLREALDRSLAAAPVRSAVEQYDYRTVAQKLNSLLKEMI